MTKKELVRAIKDAAPVELTVPQAETLSEAIVQKIIDKVQLNGQCTIYGLGKIKVDYRKPRTGRNPSTGEKIQVPAKGRVSFKACKAMQDVFDTIAAAAK